MPGPRVHLYNLLQVLQIPIGQDVINHNQKPFNSARFAHITTPNNQQMYTIITIYCLRLGTTSNISLNRFRAAAHFSLFAI